MPTKNIFTHCTALCSLIVAVLAGIPARAATATVAAGQAFTLSVTASGTAPFSYQWFKDGVVLTGATASSYAVSSAQTSNAGVYSSVVSNSAGSATSDSATVTLMVTSAPLIESQPLSQTVTAGTSVTFSATVSGSPVPALQWSFNGVALAGATGASLSIANVQAANAGTYSLVATNSSGSITSNNASLTVNAATSAPAITTQPVSKTVTAGASVTFSVTASGSPLPTYQWRKDGVNLSGATSASYTLTAVGTGNAGTYSVVATNSAGSVTSNGATLTVYTAPVITTQPVSKTVTAGASVTFSVTASGSPLPTYQWRKDGVNLTGATSASYTLTAVGTSNAGTYSVIATNAAGSATSSGAVLTVNTVPVITTQPVSQIVTAGVSVTFTATASGSPAPTYQWKLNGIALAGATGSTLSLTNVQAANAGSYTLVAANSAGSATSNAASLTVNAVSTAPVFTTQPVGQTATLGANVTFSTAASGSPTYQWMKNGASIPGATGASFSIVGVTSNDAGTYEVVATNSFGSVVSASASLAFAAKTTTPIIVSQPASQTVTAGAAVTFTVEASGATTLSYQWRKNGSKIRLATGASYTISSVAGKNAATYSVVVTNAAGSVTSMGAVLTVKSATAPVVYRADFNGDGKSDVIWQNSTTGECSLWLMNGTTVGSVVSLGVVSHDLQIGGTGDFNGDGKADIVWQDSATGECSVWLMAGPTVGSTASLGLVTPDWQLRRTGDFNGDGQSDVLWQNSATGDCALWLMNGTVISRIVSLGTVSPDLMLTGTGDFNQDGQSDILWQNSVTGAYGVWLMAGTTIGSNVSLGTVALDWQMSGAGDLNADGRSDILWQNLLTGECSVALMNGTTVGSNAALGTVALDWILRN